MLALVPAVAILPKLAPGAVHLADPIFDHAKIAMIDAMTRQGLPPVDPVFGAGRPARSVLLLLPLALQRRRAGAALHVSGWEADIGLTWFTAFASLSLLMGLAVWLSKRSAAAIWVVALAAAASLRAVLSWIFGPYALEPFLAPPTGFAGWLFQAAWAPQHLMSASCVVAAMLLIARYAQRQSVLLLLTLFWSWSQASRARPMWAASPLPIAALAAAPPLVVAIEPGRRLRFLPAWRSPPSWLVCLAAPFLNNQLMAVAARGGDSPIVFATLTCSARCFRRRFAAYWIGRPIGWCCCRSSSSHLCGGRNRADGNGAQRRAVAGKTRNCGTGLSRRGRTVGVLAFGQHARRQ